MRFAKNLFVAVSMSLAANALEYPVQVSETAKNVQRRAAREEFVRNHPEVTPEFLAKQKKRQEQVRQKRRSEPINLAKVSTQKEKDYAWRSLEDYFDVQLFAEVTVGNPPQKMSVITDTGSNWFWVQTTDCTSCGGHASFDTSLSSTIVRKTQYTKVLRYGSGNVYGKIVEDTACLATQPICQNESYAAENPRACQEVCVDGLSMVAVHNQLNLAGLEAEGIIGLSPTNFYEIRSELFIDEAYRQGQINQKIFSLSIGDGKSPSQLTIGDYDMERFATSEVNWHPLVEKHFWAINLQSFRVGELDVGLTTDVQCIVDSGSSFILMPKKEYYGMLDALSQTNNCWESSLESMIFCSCSLFGLHMDSFPDMTVTFDGVEYTIPKESYVENYFGFCGINVTYMDGMDMWILGLNFFHNYYTVFDQQNRRVGFADSIYSHNKPENHLDQKAAIILNRETEVKITNEQSLAVMPVVYFILILAACAFILSKVCASRSVKDEKKATIVVQSLDKPLLA